LSHFEADRNHLLQEGERWDRILEKPGFLNGTARFFCLGLFLERGWKRSIIFENPDSEEKDGSLLKGGVLCNRKLI
jgi:hypothetical protein